MKAMVCFTTGPGRPLRACRIASAGTSAHLKIIWSLVCVRRSANGKLTLTLTFSLTQPLTYLNLIPSTSRWRVFNKLFCNICNNYMSNKNGPARIWMGTLPYTSEPNLCNRLDKFIKYELNYAKGQRELGAGGLDHWQFIINLTKPQRLSWLKKNISSQCHWEPTRSDAANNYVWKEDTAIPDTRFEMGRKPMDRSNPKDWDAIYSSAQRGQLEDIPADVLVRNYNAIKRITADNLQPVAIEREIVVFWGHTGTGKSRRAWAEAGLEAYPKDPRSKFWDGYRDQKHVVVDEFRGGIDVSHMLRWLDRYPVIVEIKGSSVVLRATKIWITSNLDPRLWYPDLDIDTQKALLRRLSIIYFPEIKSD